jgi:ribosomal protein S18 acetylase RimI-like enzyme
VLLRRQSGIAREVFEIPVHQAEYGAGAHSSQGIFLTPAGSALVISGDCGPPHEIELATDISEPIRIGVRMARRNDARPLGEFFTEAWRESGPQALGFTGATDEAIREIASEDFLTMRLTSHNTRIVVAEGGRRILGFASVRGLGDKNAELSGIVVLKGWSGRGIGTRLIRKAIDVARKQGFREINVKTELFNKRAIGFYKKNGFTESGRITEKVGRMKVPLQVLERRLR